MNKTRQAPSARRIIGMVVGVIIIALGIALFKQAHLGNDSISALNMRIAELLGISLGVENICINMIFFIAEIWFGRKYIGLGTFVNGLGIGFIITAFYDPIAAFFGPAEAAGLPELPSGGPRLFCYSFTGLYFSTFWEKCPSKNWMKGPRQKAHTRVPMPTRPPSSQHSRAHSASVNTRHPKYGNGVRWSR